MKQVVTIDEMRKMEQTTFKVQNITPFDLMVHVGLNMYKKFAQQFAENRFLLIAGTGNNGGDALVFGEQAFLDGKQVEALVIGKKQNQSPESRKMTKRYLEKKIPLTYIITIDDLHRYVKTTSNKDRIVDGLFGIGLDRDVTGLYREVITWMNTQNTPVLSIDIPSGLHANTGQVMGLAVNATNTYTVQAVKQGLLLEDAMDVVGYLHVVDVHMEQTTNRKYLVDTFTSPPKRRHNTHKYHYKNVLTIGGQVGVMGAITLAGYSALVSGAGLSTIATNKAYSNHILHTYPELMYEVFETIDELQKLIQKKDAVLFGLGMRKITAFEKMVFDLVTTLDIPIILDAAGMLLLKEKKKIKNKRVIITPHYGEFAKLMNITVEELKKDLFTYIDLCIKQYHCEIILKGPSTIYATKEQAIFLNQGTPALAKAGSGDVLAGILLTYVARNLNLEQAILLHMLSAKEAINDKHEESIVASDIINHIPNTYRKYNKEDKI